MNMHKSQIAAVLGLIAARDRRTIGETDIRAWHQDIGDLDFDIACQAVSVHFRESTDYLMPAHLRRIAADLVRERRRLAREAAEQRAIEADNATRGPLADRSAEIQAFVNQVRDVIPDGDREALMPRQVAWEREHRHHQRQTDAAPNPDYDPNMKPVREWNANPRGATGAWWQDADARERHAKILLAEAGRLRPTQEATA